MAEKYPAGSWAGEDMPAEKVLDSWEDREDSEEEEEDVLDSWENGEDNEKGKGEQKQVLSEAIGNSTQPKDTTDSDSDDSSSDTNFQDTNADDASRERTLEDWDSDSESDIEEGGEESLTQCLSRVCSKISPVVNNLVDLLSDDQIFWVDGDSLLDFLSSHDDSIDWDHQGQFLYLTYMAEKYLQLFINKGGKVELIFFCDGEKLWKNSHQHLLARRALILHFKLNTSISVSTSYKNCFDTDWHVLMQSRLPTFLLMNEGIELNSLSVKGVYYNSLALVCQFINLAVVYMPSVVNSGAKIMAYASVPDQGLVAQAKNKLTQDSLRKFWVDTISQEERDIVRAPTDVGKQVEMWARCLTSDWMSWSEECSDWRTFLSVCASANFLLTARSHGDGGDCKVLAAYEDIVRVFLLHMVLLRHLPLTHRAQRLTGGLEQYNQFDAQWKVLLPSSDAGLDNASFLVQIQMCMLDILSHWFFKSSTEKTTLSAKASDFLSRLNAKSLSDLMDGRLFHQLMLMLLQSKAKGEPEPLLTPEMSKDFSQCWLLVQKLLSCCHGDDLPHPVTAAKKDLFPLIRSDVKMTGKDVWRPNNEADQFPVEEPLLPIDNRLVDDFTGDIKSRMVTFSREQAEKTDDRSQAKQFDELYHWHSLRPLTDEYVRTEENQSLCQKITSTDPKEKYWITKKVQKYKSHMQRYGESLEGGSLKGMVIPTKSHGEKSTKQESSKMKAIKKKNIEDKLEVKKEHEVKKWAFERKEIVELVDTGNFEKALTKLEELSKTFAVVEVKLDILLEVVKISFQHWSEQCKDNASVLAKSSSHAQESSLLRTDFQHPIRIMTSVQEICSSEKYCSILSLKNKEFLIDVLTKLGFLDVAQRLRTPDVKSTAAVKPDVKPGVVNLSVGMSTKTFQLKHMGHLLQRDTPLEPDPRVTGFVPDDWQRILLDVVDKKESALIVAPTSSGKTYASYYCMEKVLREDDDGVVVYVSPTKALVNQVAATVYARYSKNMPPGRSVFGVFTRDYRQDALNSQILITVPQCLEILLLSPHQQDWVSKLRYVIFDEVHCLGAEIGAEVWEHLILMIPCPFLALSATIANPHHLHSWMKNAKVFACNLEKQLKANQKGSTRKTRRNDEVRLVIFNERYADLERLVFVPSEVDHKGDKTVHTGTMFIPMHPFAALDIERVEMKKCFPADLSLSPAEVLILYDAMISVCPQDARIKALIPDAYFEDQLFIRRNKVREYERKLKEILLLMLLEEGKQSDVEKIKMDIGQNFHQQYDTFVQKWEKKYTKLPEGDAFGFDTCCTLMMALKEKNLLPALVFCYDRTLCERMAQVQCHHMIKLDAKVNITAEKEKEMKVANKRAEAIDKKARKMRESSEKKSSKPPHVKQDRDDVNLRFDRPNLTLQKTVLTPPSTKMAYDELQEILYPVNDPQMTTSLDRGVGWHHAGVVSKGRAAVETLFRKKHAQLVTATGTLALGIHMPCKTVVIFSDSPYATPLQFRQMSGRAGRRGYDLKGNVVFCGTRYPKIHQLTNASMSDLEGNFPISVSLVLQLLLYVAKATKYPEEAFISARTLLEHSFFCHENRQLQHQVKHHFLFSVQFLLQLGLIDFDGVPLEMTGLATHLHYHEPANFVFIQFLQKSLFHKLLKKEKVKEAEEFSEDTLKKLMVILCHLFARHPASPNLRRKSGYNGMVFLPPLPSEFSSALKTYNRTVEKVYQSYLSFVARYVAEEFGGDRQLPLSQLDFNPGKPIPFRKPSDRGENSGTITEKLLLSASPNIACSTFVGTTGLQDKSLLQTNNLDLLVQSQVYADINLIPLLGEKQTDRNGNEIRLNAYAYDFFLHGSSISVMRENGLKSGDAWQLLYDFVLVLKSISTSLKEMVEQSSDDIVVKAFNQLTELYQHKFNKAYPRYTSFKSAKKGSKKPKLVTRG